MRTPPALPSPSQWSALLDRALAEDIGTGDLTGELTIPEHVEGRARIETRQALVACGLLVAQEAFLRVDPQVACTIKIHDGESVASDQVLMHVHGPLRSILTAERVALNFLGRLCGIATWSQRFVEAIRQTEAVVVDTRKTTPGWRHLEKYATAVGGAQNHRMDLSDGILIKDNHIAACHGVRNAFEKAKSAAPPGIPVQVEVQSEQEALEAVEAGADFLLLDNFEPEAVENTVRQIGSRAILEASGGLTLDNIAAFARTGVSRLSVGALTHSAASADVSLEIEHAGTSPQ